MPNKKGSKKTLAQVNEFQQEIIEQKDAEITALQLRVGELEIVNEYLVDHIARTMAASILENVEEVSP